MVLRGHPCLHIMQTPEQEKTVVTDDWCFLQNAQQENDAGQTSRCNATQQSVEQQLRMAAHPCCVTSIPKQQCSREGLQVLWLGQLGNQALRVHVDPLLLGARAEVEVQAALKALLDEEGVHGHLAQAVKGLRGVVGLVFIIQQLLSIPFFLQNTNAACLGKSLHRPTSAESLCDQVRRCRQLTTICLQQHRCTLGFDSPLMQLMITCAVTRYTVEEQSRKCAEQRPQQQASNCECEERVLKQQGMAGQGTREGSRGVVANLRRQILLRWVVGLLMPR